MGRLLLPIKLMFHFWSHKTELNRHLLLGRQWHYHYAIAAFGCRGRNRTSDLLVMSQLSYLCSTLRFWWTRRDLHSCPAIHDNTIYILVSSIVSQSYIRTIITRSLGCVNLNNSWPTMILKSTPPV